MSPAKHPRPTAGAPLRPRDEAPLGVGYDSARVLDHEP